MTRPLIHVYAMIGHILNRDRALIAPLNVLDVLDRLKIIAYRVLILQLTILELEHVHALRKNTFKQTPVIMTARNCV